MYSNHAAHVPGCAGAVSAKSAEEQASDSTGDSAIIARFGGACICQHGRPGAPQVLGA